MGAAHLEQDRPFSVAVAEAAAEWFVQLSSESVTTAQRDGFQRWREADPEHERAWQRTQSLMQKFGGLDAGAGMAVLERPRSSARRRAIKHLVVMLTVGGAVVTASRSQVWEVATADYRTAVGEQQTVTLEDGTELVLDTATALDVRFDAVQRLLVLHAGAVMVTTGHRPQDAGRPLRVQTTQGVLTALGTRFSVRAEDGASRLDVFEGAVEVRVRNGKVVPLTVSAGEGTRFDAARIASLYAVPPTAQVWTNGVLFADAMRLEDFASELSRYRHGYLACDPAVGDLRITGSFPLHDTEAVLRAVTDSLPVRTDAFTRFWVRLVPAG